MLSTLTRTAKLGVAALLLLLTFKVPVIAAAAPATNNNDGFVQLFNGKDLTGWQLIGGVGPGYVVKDGVIVCPADGGGNLYTNQEYSDFIFRFEFKLSPDGNNGVGLRAPLQGDAAYVGMESQILDDTSPQYAHLEPGQYHSSIYKVVAAKRGSLRPVGEWNREEIVALGRHIKITVNGMVTVDANLNDVTDPHILAEHPGFRRDRGFVGFLGHGPSEVQFRNIYIKDLTLVPVPDPQQPQKRGGFARLFGHHSKQPQTFHYVTRVQLDNTPPEGFTSLFNGKDLSGWKGLVADPPTRAKMTPEPLATAEKAATVEALKHWKVVDGVITYDGKNNSLCTAKDYGNFEMLVDWKIEPKGDSGIYLRGSPQVQIWDNPLGSGGLYNNQKNPSNPTKVADKPVGQWNRFRILMVGDKVTVHLNNELVVNNVTMENYWERDKPIYPTGQIELQHHGDALYFKNIYIRELPRQAQP